MACKHGKAEAWCPICREEKKKPSVVLAPIVQPKVPTAGITVATIPRTVDELIESYRKLAKQFTEADFKIVRDILTVLAGQRFAAPNDAELQRTVMAALVERRRPKLNGRPVCIGLPYRDDQGSKAILEDARRVAEGTLCEIFILAPHGGLGQWSALQMVDWAETNGFKGLTVRDGVTLRSLNLDAIYVSGGPFDNPKMTGGTRNQPKENRAVETRQRHAFEESVIKRAVAENLPVLGICGGSWRLASTIGLEVALLGKDQLGTHAKAMTAPLAKAHTVEVRPYTMLNQILQTDNYRTFGTEQVKTGAVINANSVHWAQSVVPIISPITQSAWAPDKVTEAFEDKKSHFVIGIQWHPEYAMDGLEGSGDARQHRQVLRALGDAARDGRAATTLQKHMRAFLAAKKEAQATGKAATTV